MPNERPTPEQAANVDKAVQEAFDARKTLASLAQGFRRRLTPGTRYQAVSKHAAGRAVHKYGSKQSKATKRGKVFGKLNAVAKRRSRKLHARARRH